MKYRFLEKWNMWSKSDDHGDLRSLVENELETNDKTYMLAFRFGRQIRSRTIVIPLSETDKIIIKRVSNRCQIKHNDEIVELENKEFNKFWKKCIDKKYKYHLK
jgi:hypothetical protein